MAAPFWKVKCTDCSNEQVVFSRAASEVSCTACGATVLTPRGGEAQLKGELVATLE